MRPVLKMKLPADGSKVYAIPVKSSGSGVKRPKIFSLTTLPLADLPYDVLTEGWDEALRTLKLRPRDWKFFIEVYRGASWLVELWLGTKSSAPGDNTLPPNLEIPSPRMGRGGYDSGEFEDDPQGEPARDAPFRGGTASESGASRGQRRGDNLFPKRGNSGASFVSSAGSSEQRGNPLAAVERRVRSLVAGAVVFDASSLVLFDVCTTSWTISGRRSRPLSWSCHYQVNRSPQAPPLPSKLGPTGQAPQALCPCRLPIFKH